MIDIERILKVDDLFPDSRALPLEIVTVLDNDNPETKYESIKASILNLDRALKLHIVFNYLQEEDPEQLWVDAMFLLDEISFFAILCLPMLRQYIEDNSEVDTSAIRSDELDEAMGLINDDWLKCLKSFDREQSNNMSKILFLAAHSKRISKDLATVSDKKELKQLLSQAYEYCIKIVFISSGFRKIIY